MSRGSLALALVLLLSFRMAVHKQGFSIQPDFQVYYTAASLVRIHQSVHLYDNANDGLDPQLRLVNPQTVYARTAASMGLVPMMLFVYPPLLADAMIPVTLLPRTTRLWPPTLPAMIAWRLVNSLAVVATAWLLMRMLGLSRRLGVLLFFGIFFSGPVSDCIGYGQVAVLLMLLWTASLAWMQRGSMRASALLMAVATAIKLTPVLALAPLVCWREWKWVRWYGLGLLSLTALMCLWNGPHTLADYFEHVLPSMSHGVANDTNKTIASSLQLAWLLAHNVPLSEVSRLRMPGEADLVHAPAAMMLGIKAGVLVVLALLIALVVRVGRELRSLDRLFLVSSFGALSVALAPVSWEHAYCLSIPMLVLSWARMLRSSEQPSPLGMLLLTLVSIETGSFAFEGLARRVLHGPALALTGALVPILTVAWIAYECLRLRREHVAAPAVAMLAAAPMA